MKHFKAFVCLLTMFLVVSPAALASASDRAIWWELESQNLDYYYDATLSKAKRIASPERPKTLILRQGGFPPSGQDEGDPGRSLTADNAKVWIRNPDGEISEVNPSRDGEIGSITLNLPSDLNAGDLTGSYLVGVHLDAGTWDIDSDGRDERVHLYSNCLVRYYKRDGTKGENPDMFFNDPDKITLEIGPFIPEKIFRKRAGRPLPRSIRSGSDIGYVRGTSQSPLKEHKMKVFYKGRPLADAEVLILSKSGWEKTVMTDSEGVLSIIPPKTKLLSSVVDMTAKRRSNGKMPGDTSMMGKMIGKGMEKSQHKGEDRVRHAGQGMTKNAKHRMGKKPERATYESVFRTEDKLLYMVAYKDASAGEYHCATLPISLQTRMMGGNYRSEWRSKSKGFGFWGIMGASLGIVGVTGAIYRKRRRDRETIFKSKKL